MPDATWTKGHIKDLYPWRGTQPHAGDKVFESVATKILRGEIGAGKTIDSELDLAIEFGVSKLVVREALHRLSAAQLLVVRRGERAKVVSPWESCSLEVIALVYRHVNDIGTRDDVLQSVLEKQYTQGLSMVEVLSRRGAVSARARLFEETNAAAPSVTTPAKLAELEKQFWTAAADATGNRILEAEVRFWYEALEERPQMPPLGSVAERARFYVELARLIAEGKNAVAFYMEALAPTMRAVHTMKNGAPKTRAAAKTKAAKKKKNGR
jgi:DNA-binding FadR family transcriptional regulator